MRLVPSTNGRRIIEGGKKNGLREGGRSIKLNADY